MESSERMVEFCSHSFISSDSVDKERGEEEEGQQQIDNDYLKGENEQIALVSRRKVERACSSRHIVRESPDSLVWPHRLVRCSRIVDVDEHRTCTRRTVHRPGRLLLSHRSQSGNHLELVRVERSIPRGKKLVLPFTSFIFGTQFALEE